MIIQHKTTEQKIFSDFERFLSNNKHRFNTEENIELLRKAFKFAYKAHQNMLRVNGEPYIVHTLETAKIVTEKIGMGTTSAVAALLHDITTKTEYTLEDIKSKFGNKIFSIVSSLEKIKKTEYFENYPQASVLREILLSISDDIRVIFIKIADKLHNIRTVEEVPVAKQKQAIEDILNIYAPLSHRLGLYDIKTEMEDICLRVTNPVIYKKIANKLESTDRERIQLINKFIEPVKSLLEHHKIKFEIQGRPKSIFSIWKKMEQKQVPFKEIYDLYAVRIIFKAKSKTNENFETLRIGALITDMYPEKRDRRRNWLKNPKDTGYRALHITVMSADGRWVEVQIRSEEMHEAAEYGLAAHWKYKGLQEKKSEFDQKVREILEYLAEDNSSALTFIDNLKINLFTSDIYVFTPKGDVHNLPKGATILDFAFKIHSNLALKAIAGKINGKPQALNTELNIGDQVEILTTKNQVPQKEWFDYVITQKALYHLKKYFKQDIEKSIEFGKEKLELLIQKAEIDNIGKCTDNIRKQLNYRHTDKLFEDIGENKISESILIDILKKYCAKNSKTKFWQIKSRIFGEKSDFVSDSYVIANCCNPLPGNEIIGIEDKEDNKIIIHRMNCPKALTEVSLKHNDIDVSWTSYTAISILKNIKITGNDQPEMISKIIAVFSKDLNINIKTLNYENTDNSFIIEVKLYIKQESYTESLIKKLNKIPAVKNVQITN
jgi:GTP diphosphokinase / guanosine-3',5'-bis(diphosphate) 3'-diphosphatase